ACERAWQPSRLRSSFRCRSSAPVARREESPQVARALQHETLPWIPARNFVHLPTRALAPQDRLRARRERTIHSDSMGASRCYRNIPAHFSRVLMPSLSQMVDSQSAPTMVYAQRTKGTKRRATCTVLEHELRRAIYREFAGENASLATRRCM